MAKKTSSPTGVSTQPSIAPASAVAPLLQDIAAAARADQQVIHQATQRLADAQAAAILPYANGTVLNAMVADRLAGMLGGSVEADHGDVNNIVEVFAIECDDQRAQIGQISANAASFIASYTEASQSRLESARSLLASGGGTQRALSAGQNTDTWEVESNDYGDAA
jgi:hypothetical protein